MAPHNSQWEAQIEDYRRNRRLLAARNIDFKASRATFEADVRAKLTKPGSVIFLWPPPSSAQYSNPNRHRGWVMLAFNQRPDARTAEVDLKDYVFRNRPIRVDRAMRFQRDTARVTIQDSTMNQNIDNASSLQSLPWSSSLEVRISSFETVIQSDCPLQHVHQSAPIYCPRDQAPLPVTRHIKRDRRLFLLQGGHKK
ncbi:hypothetical protein AUP68_09800 [Ilyonectria robusta]